MKSVTLPAGSKAGRRARSFSSLKRPGASSSRTDTDAQLLRAVLLTNGGKLAEAESICQEILSQDELHAGADAKH